MPRRLSSTRDNVVMALLHRHRDLIADATRGAAITNRPLYEIGGVVLPGPLPNAPVVNITSRTGVVNVDCNRKTLAHWHTHPPHTALASNIIFTPPSSADVFWSIITSLNGVSPVLYVVCTYGMYEVCPTAIAITQMRRAINTLCATNRKCMNNIIHRCKTDWDFSLTKHGALIGFSPTGSHHIDRLLDDKDVRMRMFSQTSLRSAHAICKQWWGQFNVNIRFIVRQ